MDFQAELHPHRRLNALTGEWVLVSPHRATRPWQGQRENQGGEMIPAYDPHCYLCPGNRRAGDALNPNYTGPFVFQNDFSALLPDVPPEARSDSELTQIEPVRGECRVICFSPQHDMTLALMTQPQIRAVVDVWAAQLEQLGARYRWVQIFENKGAVMGCSNPHPHGQIWAGSFLPRDALREDGRQRAYFEKHQRPILLDYLEYEIEARLRIIEINIHWVMLVPYWALWPFELLLVPRRPVPRLCDLTDEEREALSEILRRSLIRYDNLFECNFPYSMGWHGAPTATAEESPHWQLHAHFYPPLLRSASVKKFMVGYELLAEAQRDITPEQAAARLNALPSVHFTQRQAS